jgi:hypothetical protein
MDEPADINRRIAEVRVVNAEKRLMRAAEGYEKQIAQIQLDQALDILARMRASPRG